MQSQISVLQWSYVVLWVSCVRCLKKNLVMAERKFHWSRIFICNVLAIWRERNNWHFEDLERSVADLKLFFLKTLLDWVTMFGFRSFSSIHGFMDFCSFSTWFVFVLDVYFLYTQVTPLFFLIYSYYLSKKKKKLLLFKVRVIFVIGQFSCSY